MPNMKRYRKILRRLDEALLRPLPEGRGWAGDAKRAAALYDNLWRQFGLGPEARERAAARLRKAGREMPCVNEWAWTAEARDAFYAHPLHRAFVRRMERRGGMAWGLWKLQSEPGEWGSDNAKLTGGLPAKED